MAERASEFEDGGEPDLVAIDLVAGVSNGSLKRKTDSLSQKARGPWLLNAVNQLA